MKCLVSSLVLLLALCCFGIAQDNRRSKQIILNDEYHYISMLVINIPSILQNLVLLESSTVLLAIAVCLSVLVECMEMLSVPCVDKVCPCVHRTIV